MQFQGLDEGQGLDVRQMQHIASTEVVKLKSEKEKCLPSLQLSLSPSIDNEKEMKHHHRFQDRGKDIDTMLSLALSPDMSRNISSMPNREQKESKHDVKRWDCNIYKRIETRPNWG